ncbi:glutamate-5-semialdehyde dehydrogenase [Tepidamorphus sp. 3E244]|uniref:glutamate-5-semialdehyde dehydrogenase n=1 Tax=Tepidamorphus sp. 3E244 TaxID=3385498 RepID=UPI0038FD20E5
MDAITNPGTTGDVAKLMEGIGRAARAAARKLATSPADTRNAALTAMAKVVRDCASEILAANQADIAAGQDKGLADSFVERMTLNDERIEAMAAGIESIAALPDPVGSVIDSWERPNGLKIERVRTPLGVIGIIFESRPNVTADAGALCVKAGNAAILRSGSDALGAAKAIHACLQDGLEAAGLPREAIQLVPVADRDAVGEMLGGLGGNVDVIVPRGGKGLVGRVEEEARVPVFAHLEGICHVYVHADADLGMAKDLIVNAKMRRTSICGAAECILVDAAVAQTHAAPIAEALIDAGCEVRGDTAICEQVPGAVTATEHDWGKEHLGPVVSMRVVENLDAAADYIATYGSAHTEAIITDDQAAADRFMHLVDSAIVMHNASTQFADGGEFGMGAEIGIATGRMHARGPVGVEQLTSFKYRVRGTGQTRP